MTKKQHRISFVVYDDNKKKLFKRDTVELGNGLNQLSEFLETKLGIKGDTSKIAPKMPKCAVCKQGIERGKGTTYKNKQVHKTCMAEAVQWL